LYGSEAWVKRDGECVKNKIGLQAPQTWSTPMFHDCHPKIVFKNSVPIAKKALCVSITKTYWGVMFRKITAVHSENHEKSYNTFYRQNYEFFSVETNGICNPL
jgi:hypothetical protein